MNNVDMFLLGNSSLKSISVVSLLRLFIAQNMITFLHSTSFITRINKTVLKLDKDVCQKYSPALYCKRASK